jgi:hypothetical protein
MEKGKKTFIQDEKSHNDENVEFLEIIKWMKNSRTNDEKFKTLCTFLKLQGVATTP